jgi:hypothetical protein
VRAANLAATVAALLGALGCVACGVEPVPDADAADADGDDDRDERDDADRDEPGRPDGDADADEALDTDVDDSVLPPPEPVELVEVPVEREGLDCGLGCRQLSFAESIHRLRYSVDSAYVAYESDAYDPVLYLIDTTTHREYQVLSSNEAEAYALPAVSSELLVFTQYFYADPRLMRVWTYEIWDDLRYPLVSRRVTERSRPVSGVDVSGGTVAWYDSASTRWASAEVRSSI